MKSTLLWVRRDLRLDDNLALRAAVEKNEKLIIVYIYDPKMPFAPGNRSQSWLKSALEDFSKNLKEKGLFLTCLKGDEEKLLLKLLEKEKVETLYFNKGTDPHERKCEEAIKRAFKGNIVEFEANILFDPASICNKQGKPFQVFTPFWKTVQKIEPTKPRGFPRSIAAKGVQLQSDALGLAECKKIWKFWDPTENGAKERVKEFIKSALNKYETNRDFPAIEGTSKLSPYLHFGQISIRRVWDEVGFENGEPYLRELAWREFAHHLLYHFPDMPRNPINKKFNNFGWKKNERFLKAWQEGKTGYAIVDAGMKELEETGWMHNRVRMIVGSFLVKHLLISWHDGFDWFWDQLVDADLANNSLGWQWIGGCGADAAPYFRVFNPLRQQEKFDPDGEYIDRFVDKRRFCEPIIDLDEGRKRALEEFEKIKSP